MSFQFNAVKASVTISGGISTKPTSTVWDVTLRQGMANNQGTTIRDVFQAPATETVIITQINYAYTITNQPNEGLLIGVYSSADALIYTLYDSRNANNSSISAQWERGVLLQPVVLNNQKKIRATGGAAGTVFDVNALGFKES